MNDSDDLPFDFFDDRAIREMRVCQQQLKAQDAMIMAMSHQKHTETNQPEPFLLIHIFVS